MKTYTPFEYLLIDIATHAGINGIDKGTFEQRIEWAKDNMDNLSAFIGQADEPYLYQSALIALDEVKAGKPTGHAVGLDAIASGFQILGVLTGCVKCATHTGMIDPDVRSDAYEVCNTTMNKMLPMGITCNFVRGDVKDAMMPWAYGSYNRPIELFGEETVEYEAFIDSMEEEFPGAVIARETLMNAWRAFAIAHEFVMPDGHTVYLPTTDKVSYDLEYDIDGESISIPHRIESIVPSARGIKLVAHVTHATDGYVVREMEMRALTPRATLQSMREHLELVIALRDDDTPATKRCLSLGILLNPAIQYIDYTKGDLVRLLALVDMVMEYQAYDLYAIHDAYHCSPVHMNRTRFMYREIMAEIADSDLFSDILTQLAGRKVRFKKLGNIGNKVRKSNYPLA